MDIIINERLKELRKAKGNTQEELAAFLGISVQAVSKWERGEGYPDITLLPAVASYYDISVDSLLGVDAIRKEAKYEEYQKQSLILFNQGKTDERVALWRKAYAEFPNDQRAIYELLCSLYTQDAKKNADEIIRYGELLLNSEKCAIRFGTIQKLCFTYLTNGKKDDAKKYALMAPIYHATVNQLMQRILEGEEAVSYCQSNIQSLVDLIAINTSRMLRNGNFNVNNEIKAMGFVLNCYKLLYDDENYGFFHCRIAEWNRRLAKAYLKKGDIDSMYACLEKAVDSAVKYDSRAKDTYTAFMVNLQTYMPEQTLKDHTENNSALMLNDLRKDDFDNLRNESRFKAITVKLEKVAVW
jgi:transcriptional regulator with XRE-family HTH domain